MNDAYNEAFILAAGIGSRMRPFTDHTPKPLAEIGGETLIGRILDKCDEAGVTKRFINTHHLAVALEVSVGNRAYILHEPTLLDTGGGVKKAVPYLSGKPFYIVSGDGWWQDGATSVFQQLADAWDDKKHDIILVLQRVDQMNVTPGVGDYYLENGFARRARDQKGTHMFTSIRLCCTEAFAGAPDAPFSFLELMDAAERQGRLGAIEIDGVWQHLSTEKDVTAVNAWLKR